MQSAWSEIHVGDGFEGLYGGSPVLVNLWGKREGCYWRDGPWGLFK